MVETGQRSEEEKWGHLPTLGTPLGCGTPTLENLFFSQEETDYELTSL